MPIPKHLQGALSTTSSGVSFQWLIDGFHEHRAANSNQLTLQALVGWEDSETWIRDVTGYTTWSGTSATFLTRYLAMECPLAPGLWLDSAEAVGTGVNQGTTLLSDPFHDNAPNQDWIRYQVNFVRPKWWFRTDNELALTYGLKEQFRYCSLTRRYLPRERKMSSYGFEFLSSPSADPTVATNWTASDEVGFIPDYQVEYVVIWRQVPVTAVPDNAIANGMTTVNSAVFQLDGVSRIFQPGELLFKGPQQAIEWYQGADRNYYVDLLYTFAFQPGGWNNQVLRALIFNADGTTTRQYTPVRARNMPAGTPNTPPYPSSNFQLLFTPGD